jgi:hypothetical protein
MNKTFRPHYFDLCELVPPDVLHDLDNRAWSLLDIRILWTADALRRYFSSAITINDYDSGYTLRGWRPHDSVTGAMYSQHKYGRALDMTIKGVSADDARQLIKQAPDNPAMQYITAIELYVPWLHVDCRYTGSKNILWFKK